MFGAWHAYPVIGHRRQKLLKPSAASPKTRVPHLGTDTLQCITWSTVSGFKGLENDVILVAGLTDIESDWHRGVTYVGMSRARTRLHVIIHEDCDKKRRAREEEWRERVDSDVEMFL